MAERDAREAYEAMCSARHPEAHPATFGPWESLGEPQRAFDVGGHAALLRDLSRPQARDAWARWLAEMPRATVVAPDWTRCMDSRGIAAWVLYAPMHSHGQEGRTRHFASEAAWAEGRTIRGLIVVPGISAIIDPAAALLAAVLAVAGEVPDADR